ncbi:MAG: 4Fe-4S binding protein [Anaerolineae bacterium]|nr:4Fe-4S binding protein [Anaerolineae bacterium]
MATVWLDVARCTGCGACVEICPGGALTLVENKACLNDALCRGCEACVQACPVGALQPVLAIDAVPAASLAPEQASPSAPISPRPNPLATALSTGVRLAIQAAPLVLRVAEQLLLRPRGISAGRGSALTSAARLLNAGRQLRHRQRGGQ